MQRLCKTAVRPSSRKTRSAIILFIRWVWEGTQGSVLRIRYAVWAQPGMEPGGFEKDNQARPPLGQWQGQDQG